MRRALNGARAERSTPERCRAAAGAKTSRSPRPGEDPPDVEGLGVSSRHESGAVLGFLLGALIDYGILCESAGSLELLVVDESARGQGVGRRLSTRGSSGYKTRASASRSRMRVRAREAFYERCGFKRCEGPWLVWVPGD